MNDRKMIGVRKNHENLVALKLILFWLGLIIFFVIAVVLVFWYIFLTSGDLRAFLLGGRASYRQSTKQFNNSQWELNNVIKTKLETDANRQ